MATADLQIVEVATRADQTAFIRFPWQTYRDNPFWVPPLIKDQLALLGPAHPFHEHAEIKLFLAKRGEALVGRIAGIIDRLYIESHREKTGFFGFFESLNEPAVAHALLAAAGNWLRANGLATMAGPMNPSTNYECGLLVEGFDSRPTLMMPYNPDYYPPLLEGFGLQKKMDLYAYWLESAGFDNERMERVTGRLGKKEPNLRIRSIDMKRFEADLRIVKDIFNDAWSDHWGFTPWTEAEIDRTARDLKSLLVPDLVLFAFWDDEPIGFSVALPDYNQVLRRLNGKLGVVGFLKFLYYARQIDTIRVPLLGIKPAFQKKGVEGFLYLETFRSATRRGYRHAECSWVLETNPLMQFGMRRMGGKRYKTYRIYAVSL